MTRCAVVATLISSLALAACANKDAAPPEDPPPAGAPISGTERVGWDQPAVDLADLSSIQYAIYVDGVRFDLVDASCADTSGSSGFACSARLPSMPPGPHVLELASFIITDSILESGRSSPLSVVVGMAASPGAAGGWNSPFTTADGVQLRPELIAEQLESPTDLAFAPDGRLFIAEQRGSIRVVRDGRLVPAPALVLDDVELAGDGGLIAVALDPDFERNGFLYTVYTTRSKSGSQVFRLARFREAGDTLADRVVLLDEINASPARASAALGFGPDRKLYVAFDDGGDARSAGDLASFSGKILRLNPDATTPDDQGARTPVFSYEYESPRGFDWQSESRLWIVDGGEGQGPRLVAVAAEDGRRGYAAGRTMYSLPRLAGISSMTFYRAGTIPAFRGNLLAAAEEGYILRLGFDPADPNRIVFSEQLFLDHSRAIRSIRVGPDGAVYFTTDLALGRLVPD